MPPLPLLYLMVALYIASRRRLRLLYVFDICMIALSQFFSLILYVDEYIMKTMNSLYQIGVLK